MKITPYLLLVLCLIQGFFLYSQNHPTEQINKNLNQYLLQNGQEKVYVQTNADTYQIGDTVWFKASLVSAITHIPEENEKILYVDLLSPDNQVVFHKMVKLFDGFAAGNFTLDYDYQFSEYQLVAYTNYMRNFATDYFFRKKIKVLSGLKQNIEWSFTQSNTAKEAGEEISLSFRMEDNKDVMSLNADVSVLADSTILLQSKVPLTNDMGNVELFVPDSLMNCKLILKVALPAIKNSLGFYNVKLSAQKPDVKFLPEGGQMVQGFINRIAVKSIDVNGLALKIYGKIYDSQGKSIAEFFTNEQGLGSFYFFPAKGEKYRAVIDWRNSKVEYNLPDINDTSFGIQLVQDNADQLIFDIRKSDQKVHDLALIGHVRGNVCFHKYGTTAQQQFTIKVPKANFDSGIAVFTLFSDGLPVAERLVYMDVPDHLNIEIEASKEHYMPREKVDLKIKVTDPQGKPVVGSFSINAYDAQLETSLKKYDNIRNYLLYSSELNGNLNECLSFGSDLLSNVDLVMLTNGWRRFNWENVMNNNQRLSFEKEKGLYLSGNLTRVWNEKPVGDYVSMEITLEKQLPLFQEKFNTDSLGHFYSDLPDFRKVKPLRIQTYNRFGHAHEYLMSLSSNLQDIKVDKTTYRKIFPTLRNAKLNYLFFNDEKQKQENEVALKLEPRIDHYYFPGKDTFMIQEVEIFSNFLSQRDSIMFKTGNPDAVLEAGQIEQLVKEKPWYGSFWDLISGEIPELTIIRSFPDPLLDEKGLYNLRIPYGDEVFYFFAGDIPKRRLRIIVDGEFIGQGLVKRYDNLKNIDPADVESVNFIAKPKQYAAPNSDGFNTFDIDTYQDTEPYDGVEALFDGGAEAIDAAIGFMDYLDDTYSEPLYLYVTTKSGYGLYKDADKGKIKVELEGYTECKEFYSPKYETKLEKDNTIKDYRKTIYWDYNVITDSLGRANVSFYNNDNDAPISILVQGLSVKGNVGVQSFDLNSIEHVKPIAKEDIPYEDKLNYEDLGLIDIQVLDAETKLPLGIASITHQQPYAYYSANNEGICLIDRKMFDQSNEVMVSCPGYNAVQLSLQQIKNSGKKVHLSKATISISQDNITAISIVKKALLKSQNAYSTNNVYWGYFREAIAINQNYYRNIESTFNYSVRNFAGNPSYMKLQTEKFKKMEDENGHRLLLLKPNHRNSFYPIENDILSFAPSFWEYKRYNYFNFRIDGEIDYEGTTCYKISFEIMPDKVISLEQGFLYIEKESNVIRYAQWQYAPERRKYVSYTAFLQSNPLDFQIEVLSDFNCAKYHYDGNILMLQSCKKEITMQVNKSDVLKFETQVSIKEEGIKQLRDVKNSTLESIVTDGLAKRYIVKDAAYQVRPWVGFGMIKPETGLLRDAKYMHDITEYH